MTASLALMASLGVSSLALAASPVSNVGTAKVDKGEYSIEQRFGYTLDTPDESNHERLRLRQHFDYGFTDWYALRVITQQDKPYGDSLEWRSATIENRFQLFEKDVDGWDGGFRLSYAQADGDKTPHTLAMRLLAQSSFGQGWAWRANAVFEHDVGEDAESGVALELRTQLVKEIYRSQNEHDWLQKVQFGGEMFNDFGSLKEQSDFNSHDHQLGPVLKLDFPDGRFMQIGYRFGVSDASPDHLFKVFVGYDF